MGDLALCNKGIAATLQQAAFTLQQACFLPLKAVLSAAESSAFSVSKAIGCKPESHRLQVRKPALRGERLGLVPSACNFY